MDRTDDLSLLVRISHLIEDLEKNGFDNEADLLHNEFIKISSFDKQAQKTENIFGYDVLNPLDPYVLQGGAKLVPYPFNLSKAPYIITEEGREIRDPKWMSSLKSPSSLTFFKSPSEKEEAYKKMRKSITPKGIFKDYEIPEPPKFKRPSQAFRPFGNSDSLMPVKNRGAFDPFYTENPFPLTSPPLTLWEHIENLLKGAAHKVKISGSLLRQFIKRIWYAIVNSQQILPIVFGGDWKKYIKAGGFTFIVNFLIGLIVEFFLYGFKWLEETIVGDLNWYNNNREYYEHISQKIINLTKQENKIDGMVEHLLGQIKQKSKVMNDDFQKSSNVSAAIFENKFIKPTEANIGGILKYKVASGNLAKYKLAVDNSKNRPNVFNNHTHNHKVTTAQHRGEFWHELGEFGTETLRGAAEGAAGGAIIGGVGFGVPTAGVGAPVGAGAGALGGGILGAISRGGFDLADNAIYMSYSRIGKAIRQAEDLQDIMRRWLRPPGVGMSEYYPKSVSEIEDLQEMLINYLKTIQASRSYAPNLSLSEKLALQFRRDNPFDIAARSFKSNYNKIKVDLNIATEQGKEAFEEAKESGIELVKDTAEDLKKDLGKAKKIIKPKTESGIDFEALPNN